MKKKLLSLVLAGAMVASTSVSAFAATTDTEYTIGEKGQEHQVTITGDVANTKDETVQGTISVTVPTTMAFAIDKDGNVNGGDIIISNKSEEKVEVVAKQFTDSTPDSKVIIVKEGELVNEVDNNDQNNRYVSLSLTGNGGSVGLVSSRDDSSTGFVNSTGDEIADTTNTTLGKAWKNNDLTLSLSGKAKVDGKSYTAPTNAMKDTFNLVLKIQKAKSN